MKQVPEHYLTPVRDFLINKLTNFSDAAITGGLVRDLVLGREPRDTDVLIKTSMTVDEILAIFKLDVDYREVEGYGEGHFTNNYKLLLRDMRHGIDYLFIRMDKTIEQVIKSFDCSLNKGTADILTGRITPPDSEKFEYCLKVGSPERMERFYSLFLNTCTVRFADDISNEPTILPN